MGETNQLIAEAEALPDLDAGKHSIFIGSNLKLEVVCDDDDRKLDIRWPDTLDSLLQQTIDSDTTDPSDLNGLIVLHASLRRWVKYARRAIKLLEQEMTRPGYLENETES